VTASGVAEPKEIGVPPSARAPVLELAHVTKTFGPTRALSDVSISFLPGEVHALAGENGAGKSTLLNVMTGVVRPDAGSALRVGGQEVDFSRYSPKAAQGLGIALVPQELTVVDGMTSAENIFLGREPQRGPLLDRKTMRRRAAELLDRVGATFSPDTAAEHLSVAQLQLLEIARALSYESRVVAMDEPSAVLAGDELDRLFGVIRQLTADGVAVIYVSHRLDELFTLCQRYTVLKDGRVADSGAVADLDRETLVRLMVGREVTDTFPARGEGGDKALLKVRELSVAQKVHDVTFEARAGEILGVAGLQGSGRTTLAKGLFGAIPAQGHVEIDGARGPFESPDVALRAGLAYLPEDRRREGLALQHSVRWNATLLALRDLVRPPLRLVSREREDESLTRSIKSLRIRTEPKGSVPAARLSGGNQQKVVLAKWLESKPKVLVLDEPTRGIDVGAKEEIYVILRRLASEGLAVVVVSSELIEVIGLSDRILVLSQGRIAGEIDGASATEERIMDLATATPP
jgi:ABC-type sugar transport system ATPase subunit